MLMCYWSLIMWQAALNMLAEGGESRPRREPTIIIME